MLLEIAKSVVIVRISEKKQVFYPKIFDFIQKLYSVAAFVHTNLPKRPIFYKLA